MGKVKRIVFILILSLSTVVLGDVAYINVTNVQSKEQLKYPHKILKDMGYKMSFQKKSYGYAVYIGPYKKQEILSYVHKKVKRKFSNAKVVVYKTKEVSDEKNSSGKHSGSFLGFGVGYANAPSTHNIISGSVIVEEPNNSGPNYNLYAGYDFDNALSLLFNISYINASDLEFNNYYASLNYRFQKIAKLEPYFGVSLGFSSLTWNTSPIPLASPDSNNDSDDMMYGTQVGFNYSLNQRISFKLDYSCLFLNHTTNITQDATNTSKLQHNTLHSLVLGLAYNF